MYFSTTSTDRETPVSVPEYLEFQQFTQSLSVGAFRLADVNLAKHDQAIRAQAAVVDAALWNSDAVKLFHRTHVHSGMSC